MSRIPHEILEAWEKRDHACVLTTVSDEGEPNTIYVSCCGIAGESSILICNSAFGKTLRNLKGSNRAASFLFFAPGLAAYQLKGTIKHHEQGPTYERGKAFSMEGMDLKGVAELVVEEAYKGSELLT